MKAAAVAIAAALVAAVATAAASGGNNAASGRAAGARESVGRAAGARESVGRAAGARESVGRAADMGDRAPSGRAAGDTSTRAVVWAAGDVATRGPAADAIGALVRRGKPDRFLYLGDVYETGTATEFRRWYHPRFGRISHITEPTIGNHEWDKRFEGYYPYWAGQKGRRWPPWSKLRIAGWEIINLNSQAPHGTGSPQVRWLEEAVRGPGDCRIAFWHRPRYSEGAYGGAPDLNPFWNRLAGRARIVLSGHDHNLQRHSPQRGLTQYVVGAGGRARYRLHRGKSTMVWGRDDVNAALRIVLKPGRALLEFRGPRGHALDRSHASCSPGVAAPAAQ